MLYSRNEHNIVNQLYFNEIRKKKGKTKKVCCQALAVAGAPTPLSIHKPTHPTHVQDHLVTHLSPTQFHPSISPTAADKVLFLLSTSRLLEWQDGITGKRIGPQRQTDVGFFPYLPLINCVTLGKSLKGSVSSSVKRG